MPGLSGVLVSIASLVAVATVVAVTRSILNGRTTPLPVQDLITKQVKSIALLEEQNTALRQERAFDRKEMLDLIREDRDALVAVNIFLTRYEGLGGMVAAERLRHDDQ